MSVFISLRSFFLVIRCQLKEFLRMLVKVISEVHSGELLTLFASLGYSNTGSLFLANLA